MAASLFIGIDPGANGGAGILDARGRYLHSWRWQEGDSGESFTYLKRAASTGPCACYIEKISLFTSLSLPVLIQTQKLLINAGRWLQLLDLAGIPYTEIPPRSWQKAFNLTNWRKDKAKGSPLALARTLWPQAHLPNQAHDGPAVALLLAELARQRQGGNHDQT